MSAYISQHLTFRSISNVQYHRLHQTWSAVLSQTCRNAALYYLPGRLSTWLVFSWGWCQLVFDSTLHHTASFDSNTLSLAAMTSSSRSKASTKGRPQPKHGKKTAVRPSRLFTRRRPTCRATSPESIGRPSPAGSGSVYEASREPPEGYTDINNAALKALLDAHITPFTQLPEMVREELMDSTCPGAVISAGFSMDWNLDADSGRMANPVLGGGLLLDVSAYPSVWTMPFLHRHPLNTDKKDPEILVTHQTIYPRSEHQLMTLRAILMTVKFFNFCHSPAGATLRNY
ncbi:hypothetical protein C344_05150 [Cryptococcus neoformans AD1-7a]|nr:hypothetical protein C344_05150 [Cryptococcus neoformans var. grubii AD1-7a]